MCRIIAIIWMLAAAIAGVANAQELGENERAALLRDMAAIRDREPGARAEFREEKRTRLLQKPLVSEGSVAFLTPNRFRREIRGANSSLTVSNGRVLWIYYPKFNEAERYTLGQRAFFDDSLAAITAGMNFTDLEDYYNVRIFQEESGFRIHLRPKRSNLKRVAQELTIWLDDKFLLRQSALVLPNGDTVNTAYSRTKRGNVSSSEFEFSPPPDTKVSTPLGK